MSDKKQYIRVELFYGEQSMGSYICEPFDAFDGIYLTGLDEEDAWKFTSVMMTQEEIDKLPEFMGF